MLLHAARHLRAWLIFNVGQRNVNTRISRILLAGAASTVVTFTATQLLIRLSRPQTEAEWRAAERAKSRAEWAAQTRKELKSAIDAAHDPKQRKLLEYESRIFEQSEKTGDIASLIDATDGIDDFEALVLAKEYFYWQFGVCGFVDLPEREGHMWKVSISAGREAELQSPIIVDAASGIIRCAGHPTITDPLAFIRGPKMPNQALEPTPTAVTPRAPSSTSRAGCGRGSS